MEMHTLEDGQSTGNKEEMYPEYKDIQWKDFFTKRKYIPYWIFFIIINVFVVLVAIYHDKIVDALTPFSMKVRDLSWGWIIPIVVLILISFPPLFGHEIVAVLCGVVYGLWVGFAIVAAGTFFGEIGTWFAFKYALRKKAEKLERTNLNYGALARVTREGGFRIILIIRFSIIPSHFSTAVFSTCNVNFWYFAISTLLTLPKQIILVYFGVILTEKRTNKKLNALVLGMTFILTIIAGLYIYSKMKKAIKVLLEEQEERRLAREEELAGQQKEASAGPAWV